MTPHALFRGQYMLALAHVEHRGIPLDAPLLARLRDAWPALKQDVIRDVNTKYDFWDDRFRFKMARFEAWIERRGLLWPRTPTGGPRLDRDFLEDMAKALPEIADFKDARHASQHLRLEKLHVDSDGRNRAFMGAFGTITGRNAPRASQFVFGPARWLRHLIVAPPGRCLAYIDWSAQEHGVMAALSGDPGLLDDYRRGDPYLAMAHRFGYAPAGATKATHPEVRDKFKVVVLATSYGMGSKTLSTRLQTSSQAAERLLGQHRDLYPTFWRWSNRCVDVARYRRQLVAPLGWRLCVHPKISDLTLRNWMVQTTGSEMMRYALVNLIRAGIGVCGVIHDAFLIEAPEREIDRAVALTRRLMATASLKVLGGVLELRTDATVVPSGGRYQEPRGSEMWARAMRLLGTPLRHHSGALMRHHSGAQPTYISLLT
jgi:DNA polymerase-1